MSLEATSFAMESTAWLSSVHRLPFLLMETPSFQTRCKNIVSKIISPVEHYVAKCHVKAFTMSSDLWYVILLRFGPEMFDWGIIMNFLSVHIKLWIIQLRIIQKNIVFERFNKITFSGGNGNQFVLSFNCLNVSNVLNHVVISCSSCHGLQLTGILYIFICFFLLLITWLWFS